MRALARLIQVLQRGSRRRRIQAVTGLVLTLGAALWILFSLWRLVLVVVALFLGLFLLGRSLSRYP